MVILDSSNLYGVGFDVEPGSAHGSAPTGEGAPRPAAASRDGSDALDASVSGIVVVDSAGRVGVEVQATPRRGRAVVEPNLVVAACVVVVVVRAELEAVDTRQRYANRQDSAGELRPASAKGLAVAPTVVG